MVETVNNSASVTRLPGVESPSRTTTREANPSADVTPARQTSAADGNTAPTAAGPEPATEVSPREFAAATGEVSEFIQTVSRSLQISVDEDLGEPVIRVLDRDTDELVRQIPAEEVLEIARYLRSRADASADQQVLRGVLLDSER